MKKTFVITALVVGMGLFGLQQASAYQGMGGGMGGGCQKGGAGYSQLDPASKAKVDKFFSDTQDLRKQMVMKHAEERAIMRSENPEPAKAAKLAGEIFDLKTSIQAKAEAAGVQGLIGCGACQGPGKGFGQHHGGGRGMGPNYGSGQGMMNNGPDGGSAATDAPAGADAQ